MRGHYIVEPTQSGWRVRRLASDAGFAGEFHEVTYRERDVATAYAQAAVALELYLASRERREDSADLFDLWRDLDDRYEMLALEYKDGPSPAWAATQTSAQLHAACH